MFGGDQPEGTYAWSLIARGAAAKGEWLPALRHFAYAAGWKKFEPLWDLLIRSRRVAAALPILERVLAGTQTPRAAVRSHGQSSAAVALGMKPTG